MRTAWKTRRVIVDLMVETFVDKAGKIETKVIVTSHGNAQKTEAGQLVNADRAWSVFDLAGEKMLLSETTKDEAVKAFENRLVADMARWATR